MKFDTAGAVEQTVWDMRLADLTRGENRAIINRLYNGDAPFDDATAEENNVQINRNDLSGVNIMAQARRQWIQAFLKPGNLFTIGYDSGSPRKRKEWAHTVTQASNRVLKTSRKYMEQNRAAGAQTMLHGIGPSNWLNRRSVVCRPLPIASVLLPSETAADFDNVEYIAFFQEWTPATFYGLTHGPKTDPGWQMGAVDSAWRYAREQTQKEANATAFQYMPERIEELSKQDLGLWGSDAVPTIDAWDFYFREKEDGNGWYRRIILDWGLADNEYAGTKGPPNDRNSAGFLYTSKKKKYANWLSEFFHCQLGDLSAVAPFTFHGIRGLGWMLWGVCDLENRLHCKFSEALFEQLMWFFSVAGNSDLIRLKKADFHHMGAIPQGITWLKQNDRYTPDAPLVKMGFDRFRQLMAENSAAFTQEFDKGASGKEMTATETMARVNAVNSMVSGMLTLAYTYEEYKDRETMRRLCIKGNPDPLAVKFRELCNRGKVPAEMLDVDRMDIVRERAMGAGNKTLEMAQVQFLQGIRKNLGADAQRRVDHISIESATDDANLAEDLAPLEGEKVISHSMHDAQLATDRLMRGLPFTERPDMVPEDYVTVWLTDLALLIKKAQESGGMAAADQIAGFQNMAQEITKFLEQMSTNDEDRPRVREYENALNQLMQHVKAFEQRLAAAMKAQNGAGRGGMDGKDAAEIKGMMAKAATKDRLASQSHAQKTAQRQVSFELEEQRKEREANHELNRTNTQHAVEMLHQASADNPAFTE